MSIRWRCGVGAKGSNSVHIMEFSERAEEARKISRGYITLRS